MLAIAHDADTHHPRATRGARKLQGRFQLEGVRGDCRWKDAGGEGPGSAYDSTRGSVNRDAFIAVWCSKPLRQMNCISFRRPGTSTTAWVPNVWSRRFCLFDSFVTMSLRPEKEAYKTLQANIAARGGNMWPIEHRMRRSIERTFAQSGLSSGQSRRPQKTPGRFRFGGRRLRQVGQS